MKLMKKTLAVFLVMLTIFTSCSVLLPVLAAYDTTLVTDGNVVEEEFLNQNEQSPEPEIISEITEKREENIKHFKLSDGSFVVAQYSSPVHYQDDNGEWIDIDNTITETDATTEQAELFGTDEIYATNNAVDNVVFAEKSNSNTLVAYEAKDYPISLNYQSAKKSNIKITESNEELTGNDAFLTLPNVTQEVFYENVFSDVDLQYIVSPTRLKENIILKSKNAQNSFTVNYNIGELTAEVIDEQTINLMADNEIIYTISAPYMVDSNGERSEDVTLNVDKNKNGKLRVNISADEAWLQAEERAYPVTVDPTITTETTRDVISSVMIADGKPNTNYSGQSEMIVGRESTAYGYCRILAKFQLPSLKKGDIIVDAEFNVLNYGLWPYAESTPDMQVNVHELTGSWSVSNVTWNNQPSYNTTVLDYAVFEDIDKATWRKFDITRIVKQWYEDPTTNHGIMLKGANTTGTLAENCVKAYMYTERYNDIDDAYPQILLTYRNNKGLEDYWTYTTLSAGTAGTAYINDYTGNLVFIHGDVATTGLLMPVSLEHVYNGYMADNNASTYPHSGRGNKLSLQQTVKTTDISNYPYVYEDADGTQHYFYKETKDGTTKYIDEDGLNLELKVVSGGGYTITDKSDNVMTFNSSGLLTKISDAEGRSATLTYATGKNTSGVEKPFLKTITDGSGHKITLTYKTGYVNGDSQLTAITGPDGKTINYYTSGGKRSKVEYPDGTSSTYTYDNEGSLTSATSSDGYKLTFTYVNTDGAKRVHSVTESVGTTEGQTIKFTRDKVNQTIIRSSGNDAVYGNGDDIRTVYQFDNWGRTVSAKSTLGDGTNLGAEKYEYTTGSTDGSKDIGKRNRISANAATGKNINNLLRNHSFENSGNWAVSHWYSTTYTDNGTATFDSTQSYLGSKSVKIKVNSATKAGGLSMVQYVTDYVSSGTYTLSAYVKTDSLVMGTGSDVGGACVAVRITNEDGSITREYSRMLLDSTDTAVENGWQRIHLTFTVPEGATDVRVVPMVYNATGTAYFDCMQLEKNNTVNNYNLLENSGFENGAENWSVGNGDSDDGISTAINNGGSKSFKFVGEADTEKYIRQTVYVSGSEKDTYILSGYARANSVRLDMDAGRRMDIAVKITYEDGSTKIKRPTIFNGDVPESWQYASGVFTLSDEDDNTNKQPKNIIVYCGYRKQENSCYFDDISLVKEPVPTYTYDSEGNLISATENAEKNASLSYDTNDNLTSFKDERNAQYTYTYATSGNKHRLLTAVNKASGVKYAYSYYGSSASNNLKAQEIISGSGDYIIRTSTVYTDEADGIAAGAYVKRESNQHGYSTYYDYDKQSGRLNSVTDALENATTYTYDADNGNLTKVTSDGKTVNYAYDNSKTRLTGITHNGFNYNFTYDAFGNVLTTKAAGTTLMTNTYGAGNGLLNKSTYGNDDYVTYVYDDLGRTTRINKNGSYAYYWRYNANGDTAVHNDYVNDRTYYYTYDSLGRIVTESERTREGDERRFANGYAYDLSNNLTKLTNTADGHTVTTKYYYDNANRPSKSYLNAYVDHQYTYDTLGRLNYTTVNYKNDNTVKLDYTYANAANRSAEDVTYITSQISKEEIGDRGYAYTYDKVGNITKITEKKTASGSYANKATYTYDPLGQLKRENNVDLNKTIVYTYNSGGNITKRTEYPYTTGTVGTATKTVNYTYDSTWKDKLISYDGDGITYDAIGNPLTYRDGMSFTWQGRQMKTANLNGTSVSYKYNADGLRTYKKVGSTVHEYEYSGDKLFYEKRGDIRFYYRYDVNGNLSAITRIKADGTKFTLYPICNSRGDVEELRKEDGTLYARYVYDSWGNTLHIYNASGTEITDPVNLSVQNPFRYRGYYFDAESGLYYLQSRYYDPVTGRFVNADSLIDTSNVLGFNMYAYCGNNPVNNVDPTGHLVIGAIVGGVIGGAIGALSAAISGKSVWAGALTGAVTGAVSGAIVDFAVGTGGLGLAVGAAVAVTAVNVAGNATNQYINYRIEKRQYANTSTTRKSKNITNKTVIKNTGSKNKYESFSNYIDKSSLATTAVTSLVFAPVSMGTSYVVGSAFNGLEKCASNFIGEMIASSVYELNTALSQLILELML